MAFRNLVYYLSHPANHKTTIPFSSAIIYMCTYLLPQVTLDYFVPQGDFLPPCDLDYGTVVGFFIYFVTAVLLPPRLHVDGVFDGRWCYRSVPPFAVFKYRVSTYT